MWTAQPSPWIASDYRETFCRRSRGARVRPSCLERMKVWVAPQPKKRGTTEGLMKYGLTMFNKHKVRENQGVSSVAFMWWKWLVKVVPTSLCCTCNMAAPQAFLHRNRPKKIEQWIPTFFVKEFSVFLGDPINTTSELPWAWLGSRFRNRTFHVLHGGLQGTTFPVVEAEIPRARPMAWNPWCRGWNHIHLEPIGTRLMRVCSYWSG